MRKSVWKGRDKKEEGNRKREEKKEVEEGRG